MSRFVGGRLRMTAGGAGIVSALALLPAVAGANTYVVDHCRNWDTDAGGVAFGLVTGATADNCGRPQGDGAVSGAGRTYAFRARVASPLHPFAAGSSRATLVRVR